jgi:hypothetical protein
MKITWIQKAHALANRQNPDRLQEMMRKTFDSLERDTFPVPKIRKNADGTSTAFFSHESRKISVLFDHKLREIRMACIANDAVVDEALLSEPGGVDRLRVASEWLSPRHY